MHDGRCTVSIYTRKGVLDGASWRRSVFDMLFKTVGVDEGSPEIDIERGDAFDTLCTVSRRPLTGYEFGPYGSLVLGFQIGGPPGRYPAASPRTRTARVA